MLERAFLECAFFVVAMGDNQSLMGRPISNGGDASRVGEKCRVQLFIPSFPDAIRVAPISA